MNYRWCTSCDHGRSGILPRFIDSQTLAAYKGTACHCSPSSTVLLCRCPRSFPLLVALTSRVLDRRNVSLHYQSPLPCLWPSDFTMVRTVPNRLVLLSRTLACCASIFLSARHCSDCRATHRTGPGTVKCVALHRSEERRVGKECL